MNKEIFNERYGNKGGIDKLIDLMLQLKTHDEIAAHFEVTRPTVRNWSLHIFSRSYDPRAERKQAKRLREMQADKII